MIINETNKHMRKEVDERKYHILGTEMFLSIQQQKKINFIKHSVVNFSSEEKKTLLPISDKKAYKVRHLTQIFVVCKKCNLF